MAELLEKISSVNGATFKGHYIEFQRIQKDTMLFDCRPSKQCDDSNHNDHPNDCDACAMKV